MVGTNTYDLPKDTVCSHTENKLEVYGSLFYFLSSTIVNMVSKLALWPTTSPEYLNIYVVIVGQSANMEEWRNGAALFLY